MPEKVLPFEKLPKSIYHNIFSLTSFADDPNIFKDDKMFVF